jgi:hypothetical protein
MEEATMTFPRTLFALGLLLLLVSLVAHARLDPYPGFRWLEEVGVIVGFLAIVVGFCLRAGTSR